jgi:hypothetical protein
VRYGGTMNGGSAIHPCGGERVLAVMRRFVPGRKHSRIEVGMLPAGTLKHATP